MRIRTAIALAFAGAAMLPLGAYAGNDSHRDSSATSEQRHMGQSDDQRLDRGRHLGQKAGPNNPANRTDQDDRNSSSGSSSSSQPGASGGDSANSSASGQFSGNASGAGSATASGQYSGSSGGDRDSH